MNHIPRAHGRLIGCVTPEYWARGSTLPAIFVLFSSTVSVNPISLSIDRGDRRPPDRHDPDHRSCTGGDALLGRRGSRPARHRYLDRRRGRSRLRIRVADDGLALERCFADATVRGVLVDPLARTRAPIASMSASASSLSTVASSAVMIALSTALSVRRGGNTRHNFNILIEGFRNSGGRILTSPIGIKWKAAVSAWYS